MTEPVSQTAEARKFLFFKDSRLIGPSIEDKINAAVQEIKEATGSGFSGVVLICISLNQDILIKSQGSSDLWDFFVFGMCALAGIGIFAISNGAQPRRFQSGIPNKLTFTSSVLSSVAAIAAIWTLVAAAGGYIFTEQLAQVYETSGFALLVTALLVLLGALRAIQERIQWILDRRAEQGHVLAQGAESEDTNRESQPAWYQRPAK
jgi:hypothetical protein